MSVPIPPEYNQFPQGNVPPKNNGLAVAGFITSLLCCSPVGLGLSIAGLMQINKEPQKYLGKGFAVAGIIISAIGLLVTIDSYEELIALYKTLIDLFANNQSTGY